MSLALLLALQSAAQAGGQAPAAPVQAIEFDLARVKRADLCRTGGADYDIVVCGRRPGEAFDFGKWESVFETGPLLAETGIGPGAVVRAYGESVAMPGGQISKRAMVGVRLKF